MEKYFGSQQSDEDVILVLRKHWFEIFPSYVAAGFVYFIGLLAIFVMPVLFPAIVKGIAYNFYAIAVSLLFLYNTAFLFSVWLIHYLNVGLITTEHVVEVCQDSLFSRKISELDLEKIQDVSANQRGIAETMFNFGTVNVQTAGESPNFIFTHVPDPNAASQKIMELEEEYASRHGLRNPTPAEQAAAEGTPSEPTIEYPN